MHADQRCQRENTTVTKDVSNDVSTSTVNRKRYSLILVFSAELRVRGGIMGLVGTEMRLPEESVDKESGRGEMQSKNMTQGCCMSNS